MADKLDNVDPEIQKVVETELRKGSSNSRIAKLLDEDYEDAVKIIDFVKEDVRPEVGATIRFTFRNEEMTGTIEKLLDNSSLVKIDWDRSAKDMYDLLETHTIVNFKDIDETLAE